MAELLNTDTGNDLYLLTLSPDRKQMHIVEACNTTANLYSADVATNGALINITSRGSGLVEKQRISIKGKKWYWSNEDRPGYPNSGR